MKNYLNFEIDIKNLETELNQLKDPYNQGGLSEVETDKISKLQNEIDDKLQNIYSNLDPWQTVLVARHEDKFKAYSTGMIASVYAYLLIDIFNSVALK